MIISFRISFILTLAVLFTAVNANEIQCPDNEEYNECGSACQENCTYIPEFCTYQCVSGCFCKKGFVREIDDKSKCVPRSQCSCGINEFFNDCGSACPDTCVIRSQLCTKQCIPGCFCNNGFIRLNNQSNSPCIPESECKNSLCYDPNAEYTNCGSICPRTCDDECNPIRKFRICSTMCKRGCFCKKGFVLEKNGNCVKPEACCQTIKGLYKTCGLACPDTFLITNPNNQNDSSSIQIGQLYLDNRIRQKRELDESLDPLRKLAKQTESKELAQLKQEARNAADALRLAKEKVEDLQKEADKKIKKDYDKDQEFIARKP